MKRTNFLALALILSVLRIAESSNKQEIPGSFSNSFNQFLDVVGLNTKASKSEPISKSDCDLPLKILGVVLKSLGRHSTSFGPNSTCTDLIQHGREAAMAAVASDVDIFCSKTSEQSGALFCKFYKIHPNVTVMALMGHSTRFWFFGVPGSADCSLAKHASHVKCKATNFARNQREGLFLKLFSFLKSSGNRGSCEECFSNGLDFYFKQIVAKLHQKKTRKIMKFYKAFNLTSFAEIEILRRLKPWKAVAFSCMAIGQCKSLPFPFNPEASKCREQLKPFSPLLSSKFLPKRTPNSHRIRNKGKKPSKQPLQQTASKFPNFFGFEKLTLARRNPTDSDTGNESSQPKLNGYKLHSHKKGHFGKTQNQMDDVISQWMAEKDSRRRKKSRDWNNWGSAMADSDSEGEGRAGRALLEGSMAAIKHSSHGMSDSMSERMKEMRKRFLNHTETPEETKRREEYFEARRKSSHGKRWKNLWKEGRSLVEVEDFGRVGFAVGKPNFAKHRYFRTAGAAGGKETARKVRFVEGQKRLFYAFHGERGRSLFVLFVRMVGLNQPGEAAMDEPKGGFSSEGTEDWAVSGQSGDGLEISRGVEMDKNTPEHGKEGCGHGHGRSRIRFGGDLILDKVQTMDESSEQGCV